MLTETDACCGPMAAAFLRDYSPALEVASAGIHPSESIDSMAVAAMKECLIDLSDYRPKPSADFNPSGFDAVYECPDLPAPTTFEEFRELRDFIKNEAYLFFIGIRQSARGNSNHPFSTTPNSNPSTLIPNLSTLNPKLSTLNYL